VGLPSWHKLLHQSHEPSNVSALKQVDHFMHYDVLQTLARFLGQLRVQANGSSLGRYSYPTSSSSFARRSPGHSRQ
jgi:hypothetical protein